MCFVGVSMLSTMEEHTPVKQIKEVKLKNQMLSFKTQGGRFILDPSPIIGPPCQ